MYQTLLPALLFAVLSAVSLDVVAQPHALPLLAQAETALDRDEAARRAAEETGGKVLSAEPDSVDGKPVYRVKVLTPDGHVKIVVIETNAR